MLWYRFPPLIVLIITLIPLLILRRWITRRLQGLGLLLWGDSDMAMILYFLALLPGIVLHELSHWCFARLLGVKTGKIEIWPSRKSRGRIRLGAVRIGKADHLRASLIGLAPFVTGCVVIYLVGDQILGISRLIDPLLEGDLATFQTSLSGYTQASDFWIWLYVIFAVSNTMFPSESDRGAWWPVLAVLGGIAFLGYALGLESSIPQGATNVMLDLIRYLAYAFVLTVTVNLVFMLVIAIVERITEMLKGTRVEYGR
jgi:hypothetical protein